MGSAAAVIAAVVATGVIVVQSNNDDSRPASTAETNSSAEELADTAADEPEPEPAYSELAADDFTIKLRTTERQCFGSAGCNMTVEARLSYLGLTEDIDPARYRRRRRVPGPRGRRSRRAPRRKRPVRRRSPSPG
ncbi:hypothetical protein ACFY64_04465 [Streptomyces collinus]|uniref:hypothetical protein n=1 Tax=Streptomyces collinus TaxID=42684 RepID=UPI0036BB1879